IVDQHFLKRNRVNRLLDVLARYPGYAGLGVDEQTAVVVRGRDLSVVGNSYALLCLAAGAAGKPASVQVLKAGDRADLIGLSRAAVARAGPRFPPEHPAPPVVAGGALVIGGGGRLALDIWNGSSTSPAGRTPRSSWCRRPRRTHSRPSRSRRAC